MAEVQGMTNIIRKYVRYILLEDSKCQVPKAIFMAGGPGSGKSTVIKRLGLTGKIKVINADDAYEIGLKAAGIPLDREDIMSQYKPIKKEYLNAIEDNDVKTVDRLEPEYQKLRSILSKNMKIFTAARKDAKGVQNYLTSCREDFLVDGTGGDYRVVSRQIRNLIDAGYSVAMIYVAVPLEVSLERNKARGIQGGRRLADTSVERSWSAVNKNKEAYSKLLGLNFFFVDASKAAFDESTAAASNKLQKYLGER